VYERILVAIDAHPTEENASAIRRTEQIGTLTGATGHVLHVARGHIVPEDITGGSVRLGVWSAEDDAEDADRDAVQQLVDRLSAQASTPTGRWSSPRSTMPPTSSCSGPRNSTWTSSSSGTSTTVDPGRPSG
jgi:hypothetical protein